MRFVSSFFLCMLCLTGNTATITYKLIPNSNSCELLNIDLDGEISSGDAAQVSKIHNAYKKYITEKKCDSTLSTLWFRLNSNGGEVREAIAIGRFLRDADFRTIVAKNSSCLSSCVFIFIGGNTRVSFGQIGIHRPYFSDLQGTPTAKQIRELRDRNNQNTKKYLDDMDVAGSLFDAMQAIPPESMKILSESELTSFRIVGEDASANEKRISELAKSFGLTSSEYRKRDGIVSSTCGGFGNNPDWANCRQSVMYGISVSTLISRQDLAKSTCLTLPSDSEKLSCIQRIMKYGN